MYYPDDLVEEIRLRSDVVDIIGSYVHLKKSGANYVGLCPFHNEKTGSFTVSPIRQTFKCFGCGVGGNVITFLMKYENMTFQETIKFLADRAGVKLPEFELSVEKKKKTRVSSESLTLTEKQPSITTAIYAAARGKSVAIIF